MNGLQVFQNQDTRVIDLVLFIEREYAKRRMTIMPFWLEQFIRFQLIEFIQNSFEFSIVTISAINRID